MDQTQSARLKTTSQFAHAPKTILVIHSKLADLSLKLTYATLTHAVRRPNVPLELTEVAIPVPCAHVPIPILVTLCCLVNVESVPDLEIAVQIRLVTPTNARTLASQPPVPSAEKLPIAK